MHRSFSCPDPCCAVGAKPSSLLIGAGIYCVVVVVVYRCPDLSYPSIRVRAVPSLVQPDIVFRLPPTTDDTLSTADHGMAVTAHGGLV